MLPTKWGRGTREAKQAIYWRVLWPAHLQPKAEGKGTLYFFPPSPQLLLICLFLIQLSTKWTIRGQVMWWLAACLIGAGLVLFYILYWAFYRYFSKPALETQSICTINREKRLSDDLRRLATRRHASVSPLRLFKRKVKGYWTNPSFALYSALFLVDKKTGAEERTRREQHDLLRGAASELRYVLCSLVGLRRH